MNIIIYLFLLIGALCWIIIKLKREKISQKKRKESIDRESKIIEDMDRKVKNLRKKES